jgi:hypothetical protein
MMRRIAPRAGLGGGAAGLGIGAGRAFIHSRLLLENLIGWKHGTGDEA